jgi:1-acyl-sn-glycerol-3-phosphate acyltransferase
VVKSGRRPRFFAKAELWRNPFLKFVLKHAKQIQVNRGTGEAGPVEQACAAVERGEVVVIYPEATVTTNPDLTPMRGKTGVARVAIATGAPVIPIAVWGSHWVKPKKRKAVQKFRRLIMVKAGEPLSFGDLRGKENDPETLRDVTDQVIAELDRLVRELHKIYPDGAAVPELREGAE